MLALEPALEQAKHLFVGALYHGHDETGDAHLFTKKLAAAAAARGVNFRYGVTVTRLAREGDRIAAIETDQGRISADVIVLSLGAEGAILARRAGLALPIYPVKGYSVTLPTEGYNGAPEIGIHDEERRIVTARYGKRLRVAGTAELAGFDRSLNPSRLEPLLRGVSEIFPNAGDVTRAERWCGLRPMTPDCAPIIGRSPIRNLFLDTGHGALGWTLACGSGKAIADLVSGRPAEIDLSGLTLERF
jgi:D-amino-acid dehydrogenase